MTTTQIHIFDRHTNARTFQAGEVIFNEGDESGMMLAIIEGEVSVLVDGKFLHDVGPGGVVGEMSLIDPAPRSATVAAKTDCKVVPVDQKEFKLLVQQHPFFALDVMKILVERLREATALGVQYLG